MVFVSIYWMNNQKSIQKTLYLCYDLGVEPKTYKERGFLYMLNCTLSVSQKDEIAKSLSFSCVRKEEGMNGKGHKVISRG